MIYDDTISKKTLIFIKRNVKVVGKFLMKNLLLFYKKFAKNLKLIDNKNLRFPKFS